MTKKTVTDAYYHGAGSIAPMPGPSRSAKTPSPRAGEGRGEGAQPKNRHSKLDLESTPKKAEPHQLWLDEIQGIEAAMRRKPFLMDRMMRHGFFKTLATGGEYNPETYIIGEKPSAFPNVFGVHMGRKSANKPVTVVINATAPKLDAALLALHMSAAKNPCDKTLRQRRGEK